MVNGFVSRVIYLGAWAAIGLYMLGAFVLAGVDKSVPGELDKILYVALGLVGGSHLMPPLTSKATNATLSRVNHDLHREGAADGR